MKLVVTGGGTGGHVYPALEVARAALAEGFVVHYFGSQMGQEGKLCRERELPFQAFPSQPLYSLKKPKGWKAAWNIWRATGMAKEALKELAPDVVFSTGGYSSAPVVSAAKNLGIPYVIHEQNTVPGRTNRILSAHAFAVATTFRTGAEHFGRTRTQRTGLPIRKELREGMQGKLNFSPSPAGPKRRILVMGGSQGAQILNEIALAAAMRLNTANLHWTIVAGVKNYEAIRETMSRMSLEAEIDFRAYLSADEMAHALFESDVVVCRSGGSLAELAVFRKPSVLIPYPHAMGNHQHHNAEEFVEMGAASLLPQSELAAGTLAARIMAWIEDPEAVTRAQAALAEWDVPTTNEQILGLLREAAR